MICSLPFRFSLLTTVLTMCPIVVAAQEFESHTRTWDLPSKKVIEWDWGTSFYSLDYMRQHVRSIERIPFDGLVITIHHDGTQYKDGLCHEVKWTDEEMRPVFDALAAIEWKSYRHNFIAVFAGERHLGTKGRAQMDWFDDEQWDNILYNIRLLTRAVVIGKCVGLWFDPETYHRTVWNYYPNAKRRQLAVPHFETKSYDEYFDQVRKRGAQYMTAIQSVAPEIVFFNAYLSVRLGPSDTGKSVYGLYHAFLNGLLDAAGPGVTFVDGNESSYSYKTKADYDRGSVDIHRRKLALIAPENRRKYVNQVQASHALFMDEIFGIHRRRQWTGTHLEYPDRVRLFEESLFHAMDAADEYVWIYSEKMNWRMPTVPEGALAALERAKKRIVTIGIAKRTIDAELDARVREAITTHEIVNRWASRSAVSGPLIQPKRARIRRSDTKPIIDGHLSESLWKGTSALSEFDHHLHYTRGAVIAPTTAQVAWSDEGLYVGFTCSDPEIERLRENVENRQRNRLTLVISADEKTTRYYRLDFNMDGLTNAFSKEGEERAWHAIPTLNPRPQSAVQVGSDSWTAEWRVPWSSVGGQPRANQSRRATLLRLRPMPYEFTTWAQMIDPNLWDTKRLGTWVFD